MPNKNGEGRNDNTLYLKGLFQCSLRSCRIENVILGTWTRKKGGVSIDTSTHRESCAPVCGDSFEDIVTTPWHTMNSSQEKWTPERGLQSLSLYAASMLKSAKIHPSQKSSSTLLFAMHSLVLPSSK